MLISQMKTCLRDKMRTQKVLAKKQFPEKISIPQIYFFAITLSGSSLLRS
jgi:hypothetical protein